MGTTGEVTLGQSSSLEGMLTFCSEHLNAHTCDPTIFFERVCPIGTLEWAQTGVGMNNFSMLKRSNMSVNERLTEF